MAKKTNIPIFGITRNTDDGVCKDGECLELINARIKNGSLEPIGKPIQEKIFTDGSSSYVFSKLFFHSIAKKYIGILSGTGQIFSMGEDYSNISPESDSVLNVTRIEFIGYTMMAINDQCIHYFIFSNGVYRYLGTKPEMPMAKFGATGKVETVTSSEKFELNVYKSDLVARSNAETGYFTKLISKFDFVGKAMCRYALKLYDGSYIMHSPIFLINAPGTVKELRSTTYLTTGEGSFLSERVSADSESEYRYYVLGFTPTISVSECNLSYWKDIVVGIDFFISRSIPDYVIKKTEFQGSGNDTNILTYESYVCNNFKHDYDSPMYKIKNNSLFYKFAEARLTNIGDLGSISMIDDFENIALKDTLPDDQFTHNTYCPITTFVYNSRLHIGNIKENIFKGFSIKSISSGNTLTFEKSAISVYLTTSGGNRSIVKKSETNVSLEYLFPIIMYPDSRAYKMVIDLYNSGSHYTYTYDLTPSEVINAAMYISPTFVNNNVSSWTVISETISTLGPSEVNEVEYSPNKLKVSETNNPFFFPAKTTYQPSNGKIIALCSNTSALSQGQFGQHPLLIFCDDGIFAMTVGTDGIAYTNSTPVTRDVCNNAKSVKGIDNAVVFSTEQGVMMIQGTQVVNLSTAIDGYLPSCVDSSPVIGKIMAIPNLQNALSVVTFADYAKGAEIGYNYQEREIIVANPSYAYVYVYNFSSSSWCKMSLQIDSFVNSYPDILALSHRTDTNTFSVVWNMQNNHRSVADIVFISRPIKLGTLTHKRILQSAMRGVVKRSNSDLYLRGEAVQFRSEGTDIFSSAGFYILGSNDAEHFTFIAGKEKIVDVRDLITKMNKTKAFKYFMFAVVGGVRTDVAINYIELIVDESFENRLR